MKKVLIGIFLGLLIIVVGAVLLVLYLTSDIVNSTDQFFSSIREGNIEEAYQYTATEFRAATPEETFKVFLRETAIVDYDSASWRSRSKQNNIGRLEGSIKTKSGGVIPVKIELVKEEGRWKILSINKKAGGVVKEEEAEKGESQEKTVPAMDEMIAITNSSIMALGKAVNQDDFSIFYSSISKLWQSQTDTNELREAFKSFIKSNTNLTGIKGVNPIYSEKPHLDNNDWLVLKGYYPTEPLQVHFDLKYIYEYPEWKLASITVRTEEAEKAKEEQITKQEKTIPPMNELIIMTNNAIMDLAIAINSDDFSSFYNSISKLWQSQTDAKELRDIFKQFIEKNIDLTIIRNESPVYSGKPSLNKDGLLVLEGYYTTKPYAVYFELKFIYEYPKWKLFGIHINI